MLHVVKPAILIPDVHARGQLAALRSLGMAGYETHAVADRPSAVGLRSNYARHRALHPAYSDANFCGWLRAYCEQNAIKMIVPSGGLLQAVRSEFSTFQPLLPVAQEPQVVFRALDKIATYECWRANGLLEHHPLTVVVARGERVDLSAFPTPIYIKGGQGVDGETPGVGFHCCPSVDLAYRAISEMHDAGFGKVLVQGGVSGRQIGVSLFMGRNGALAGNVVADCHAEPHSKGTMSLRRTCWFQDIFDDAVRRLSALQWIGCAMMEYRRDDETGAFHVIEVNARFWQYLHLDLHAGVDFPRLLAEWFLEGRDPDPIIPKQGIVCRDTFPGEVAQLVSALRRPSGRSRAFLGFTRRFFDHRIYSDLNFRGDRMIFYSELMRFLKSEIAGLAKRFRQVVRA
jgi:predicted ATP-grasp superfamily ATP-dependent carboligase